MAVDRGMVSRSTGPKVQGLEGLIAAQEANQQRQQQILALTAKNAKDERKKLENQINQITATGAEDKYNLPNSIFQSGYQNQIDIVKDLLEEGELTWSQAADRLMRTKALLMGAEDESANDLIEKREDQYGNTDDMADFDKSLGLLFKPIDGDSFQYETTRRTDFIKGGYYGATKEDFVMASDPNNPLYFQNFISFNDQGIPFFNKTFTIDRQEVEDAVQMTESQYYGDRSLSPVLGEEFFREQSDPRGFDAYHKRVSTLERDGNINKPITQDTAREAASGFLSDPDEELSTQGRLTAFFYIMENSDNPVFANLLEESDFIDFVTWSGTKPGEKNRERFNNIVKIPELLDNYVPDIERKETEEEKDARKDRKQQAKQFDESKMRIGDSFQVLQDRGPMSIVNTATRETILDDYSGRVETYAVGDLRSNQANPLIVPNQAKTDEYNKRINDGFPEEQAAAAVSNKPDFIEIKPERLEIYPDIAGRKVVGIVSRDKDLNENPTIFLEVDGDGVKNRDLITILQTNIQNEYPGVTLDMFFDGTLKGGSTTPTPQQDPAPITPTIDYSTY